ncbi:MAG: ABC transporter permease [Bacteroidales bacterium]|nr:ABC transporter permease [Bacteroidales bacterium]
MIQTYFRQAWRLLRQNKLFSAIYIAGTALTIATTTIFAVIYYVKIEPIYPESNRHRTAYLSRAQMDNRDGKWASVGSVGLDLLYKLRDVEGVEKLSVIKEHRWRNDYVGLPGKDNDVRAYVKGVDPQFFEIYDFDFKDGRPFSAAEFESGVHAAVITDDLAMRLFGTDRDITGRELQLNYDTYRVAGVVRGGSSLTSWSFATLYMPYTSVSGYDRQSTPNMGQFKGIILTDDLDLVQRGVAEMTRRFNSSQDEFDLELWQQPTSHTAMALCPDPTSSSGIGGVIFSRGLILLILLLVPALNLSGMISGRMETRGAELGVRRSFGATRRHLLGQVVWENMVLTLIGGVLGLLLTWLLLWLTSGSLLTLVDDRFDAPAADPTLTPDMLFAPAVFGIMLVLTIVLNLLSAIVPAWITSRRRIVKSLKEK